MVHMDRDRSKCHHSAGTHEQSQDATASALKIATPHCADRLVEDDQNHTTKKCEETKQLLDTKQTRRSEFQGETAEVQQETDGKRSTEDTAHSDVPGEKVSATSRVNDDQ